MLEQKNFEKKYYLGLDIGTDSVGWAVTDEHYNIQKFKSNLMWGVNIFDEASTAKKRRAFRTSRRRLDRRQQRIALLQELIADDVLKTDSKFFFRLKESALLPEDSEHRNKNIVFDDEDFKDNDYADMYPTIHHLICELMDNPEPHDIRLVYIACAYLLAHRGHFLCEVDKDNVAEVLDFSGLYKSFLQWFDGYEIDRPFEINSDDMEKMLRLKVGVTQKEKAFKQLMPEGKITESDDYPIKKSALIKMISGGKVKLSELFKKDNYADLETNTVCIDSADFSDALEAFYSVLDDGDADLLSAVKAMNDWAILSDILGNSPTISSAKVKVFEKHKHDLKILKGICKKYLSENEYKDIFKKASESTANYVKYSHNIKSISSVPIKFDKAKQADFCKYISKMLSNINPNDSDASEYKYIMEQCSLNSLCPKQVSSENRVIPYQLYYSELKKILDNAEHYLDCLKKSDEYGTVKDKILSIMLFRVPYYVGPLVSSDKSNHAWMVRKAEGKIYPWNFDDKVDKDKSENEFIRRMTCKCTYVAGEDVLPKNSLLYCKYAVLNEINSIKINDIPITVAEKQTIYNLFEKQRKVTVKSIKNCLISIGSMTERDNLTGIDITVKSSLKSYHDFKRILSQGVINDSDAEAIIERLTITTDRQRFKKWLSTSYGQLNSDDIKFISKLKYSDYGRLSAKLLCDVYCIDTKTGEAGKTSVIETLWNTNDNLMQILSDKYEFGAYLEILNSAYYSEHPRTLAEQMQDMYLPVSVTKAVHRTLSIAKELKTVLKKQPDKIFIEMARGASKQQENLRTISRKEQLKSLLESAREFEDAVEIDNLEYKLSTLDDSTLRSEKYFLYFSQLGKSMYSGKTISFEALKTNDYNIDHIYPQSKIKDDSLDNKVLVLSVENGDKLDIYPIDKKIRDKMTPFWIYLYKHNLISEKKYGRLIRSTSFTEDELVGFINRQLVETRQSTKAVATLIRDIFPDSEIVYVKSGLVSDFRQEYDMLKCREINDIHHAKDAYLNIVMGNVYNVRFTKNPISVIKSGEKYSVKLKTLLSRDIVRNGVTAWSVSDSFDTVKRNMAKNSIRFVKYTYKRSGGFFHQNLQKAGPDLAPSKSGLDTEKYGGYNNTTASYFAAVKNGDNGVAIIPIELLYADKYENDLLFAKEYVASVLSAISGKSVNKDSISFPFGKRILKINTLIELDGFRVFISSKANQGKRIDVCSAVQLISDKEIHDYIKKLTSYYEKSEKGTKFPVPEISKISSEMNVKLYDFLCGKCLSKPFSILLEKMGSILENGKSEFLKLSVTEQVGILLNMVSLLKTNRVVGCDLSKIGGSKQAGVLTIGYNVSSLKYKTLKIVDQSPTGLFEKHSENLIAL